MKRPKKPAFRPSLDDKLARIPTDPSVKPPVMPSELNDVDPSVLRAISNDARTELRAVTDKVGPKHPSNESDELLLVMAGRLRTLEQEVKVAKDNSKSDERQIRHLHSQLQDEKNRVESLQQDKEKMNRVEEEVEVLKIQATRLTRQNLYLRNLLQANHIEYEEMGDSGFIPQPPPINENIPPSTTARRPMTEPQFKRPSSSHSLSPLPKTSLCDDNTPFVLKKSQVDEAAASTKESPALPFNMKVIMKNIRELNSGCGPMCEVGREVQSGRNIHKFHERKVINILFYLDGLCLNDGPFRPYKWPAAQAVVQDLMDGYFPYEFKQSYPDGVPLFVIDKTSEKCPNRNVPVDADKKEMGSVIPDKGYKLLSKNAFLEKLPKAVVKNGQLVDVRGEVANLLGGEKRKEVISPIIVPTAALQENQARQLHDAKVPTDPTSTSKASNGVKARSDPAAAIPRGITTIQVKSSHPVTPGEMCVFIVHMFYTQTVGELRTTVRCQLQDRIAVAVGSSSAGKPSAEPKFTLCTGFPMVALTNDKLTLEEAQLTPTATVHVRIQ